MTDDLHTSTTAAPSPVVAPADAGPGRPAGSAVPPAMQGVAEKPEVLVGAAFAGGVVLAFLLKRIGRG